MHPSQLQTHTRGVHPSQLETHTRGVHPSRTVLAGLREDSPRGLGMSLDPSHSLERPGELRVGGIDISGSTPHVLVKVQARMGSRPSRRAAPGAMPTRHARPYH